MQQSSATQSLHLSFWGLRKIVACSHSSSVTVDYEVNHALHCTIIIELRNSAPIIFTRVIRSQSILLSHSPFVYRDHGGWQAALPYIRKSAFQWQ